ncbi:MAG: peptide deformylase [Actinomycetota bacterium]|nr:peptide deformylase [Actinomycetota bacterium]
MTILPIRQLGDPVLRERARPVERFDAQLARLAADMLETMYDAPGVGLAAPQIGISLRLVVFDEGSGSGPQVLANPEVFDLEGEEVHEEGCLSVRGPYAELGRALKLRARGLSLTGERVEFEAEGLLARIMQHETDHLDGTLFIDRLTDEARREVMRQLREQELSRSRTGRFPRGGE